MTRPPFPAVLDSTIVGSFRSCRRKAYLEYVEHWKPRTVSVHLHAGGAYAKGLEEARKAYFIGVEQPDGTIKQVSEDVAIQIGLRALMRAYGAFECPPDSAKSLERMCGAFEYYFTQYPMSSDKAVPVTLPGGGKGIEFSFAEPIIYPDGEPLLHPETGDPLIYCGRMDMIANYAGGMFGEDDKTTSSLGASWSKQWDLRCFSGDTEILTRAGWRRIDCIQEGEDVLQYNKGEMEFVPAADVHSTHFAGRLISLQNGRLDQLITPNHRILLELRRGGEKVVEAAALGYEDKKHKIPLSGVLQGEKLPAAVQRYIVALQADGSLRSSKGIQDGGQGHREHMPYPAASFKFVKGRKIERLRSILRELGVEFTEHEDGSFYVSGFTPLQELVTKLLDENKMFREDTFELYDETFLEELEYWDGWASQYYTIHKKNAEFVQTVAHTNGWRASVQLKITHTQSYVVCLSKQISCELGALTMKRVGWDAPVYCLSVPSGFLLIRRGGVVSVSGNSQFTGYCWGAAKAGFPLQGFLVRGVSILKTKFETQQAITYRPQWMIDRWHAQLIRDVEAMIVAWESGYWDYNLDHSCNEFGGCIFKKVCLSEQPEDWLEVDFEKRIWDPLKREEKVIPIVGVA